MEDEILLLGLPLVKGKFYSVIFWAAMPEMMIPIVDKLVDYDTVGQYVKFEGSNTWIHTSMIKEFEEYDWEEFDWGTLDKQKCLQNIEKILGSLQEK